MYLLSLFILILPMIISGLFSRFLGSRFVSIFNTICVIISTFFSIVIFYEVIYELQPCFVNLWEWVDVGVLNVKCAVLFDSLSVTLLFVVTFVSSCVHLYSVEYLKNDPHLNRFFFFLTSFTFFMVFLVLSSNLLLFFLSWEGVGICSYLLINFWFTRYEANRSALKAVFMNKIGDVFLYISIVIFFLSFCTLNFQSIFLALKLSEIGLLNFVVFCLIIASAAKSAQIGLHLWLPDAMEGPTPVSALLHAATMVVAGVFLFLRLNHIFVFISSFNFLIFFLGGFTCLYAASVALFQNDIKKVIAYSTCSQLGYMFAAVGVLNFHGSLFHLFNHAFFKALLFLGSGVVIHILFDEQDFRKMGSIINFLPFIYISMLIGSLSLMGLPFMSGYYSKDNIIELFVFGYKVDELFVYNLLLIAIIFTSFYSFRLLYLTFLSFPVKISNYNIINKLHNPSFYMSLPVFFLGFFSIFSGYYFYEFFLGIATETFNDSFKEQLIFRSKYFEELVVIIKILPAILILFAFFFMYLWIQNFIITEFDFFNIRYYRLIQNFLLRKWFFDNLLYYIIKLVLNFSFLVYKLVEKGFLEFFGPIGFINIFNRFSYFVIKLQNGIILFYLLVFFLFFIFFFFFCLEFVIFFFFLFFCFEYLWK